MLLHIKGECTLRQFSLTDFLQNIAHNLDTFIFNQAGQLYQLCIRYMHTSVKHEEVCPVQIRDNSCNTCFASLIKGKGNHNAHLTAVH